MQFSVFNTIASLGKESWHLYKNTNTPFTCYDFHKSLEDSGCIGGDSGWQPLLIEITHQNQPQALAIAYLKHHSWGEYVFDFAWAQAYQHYQLPYYPKLVSAIPFTPCAGPRILFAPHISLTQQQALITNLVDEMPKLAQIHGFYSWHWLFDQDDQLAVKTNLHQRLGCQYHWYNQSYACFDDFLAQLNSRKRKNIRKERQQMAKADFTFYHHQGADITQHHLQQFYQCYANTYHVRGRNPYLNQAAFALWLDAIPEKIILVEAQKNSQTLAYAWYFIDEDTLYGRYWGCLEEHNLLHFETCYYQGIDYCIQNKIKHFDAGAQGQHKLARGFIPQATHSYHWLQETKFNAAIDQFCQQERQEIQAYLAWAKTQTPYKVDCLPEPTTKKPLQNDCIL